MNQKNLSNNPYFACIAERLYEHLTVGVVAVGISDKHFVPNSGAPGDVEAVWCRLYIDGPRHDEIKVVRFIKHSDERFMRSGGPCPGDGWGGMGCGDGRWRWTRLPTDREMFVYFLGASPDNRTLLKKQLRRCGKIWPEVKKALKAFCDSFDSLDHEGRFAELY